MAGEISQYMLELSRIDTQQKGERNYHIFYQLCGYLHPDLARKCRIRDIKTYNFLNKVQHVHLPSLYSFVYLLEWNLHSGHCR